MIFANTLLAMRAAAWMQMLRLRLLMPPNQGCRLPMTR
jgi:hypothetical protein